MSTKIFEGIMRGNDLAFGIGKLRKLLHGPIVERVKRGDVGIAVALVQGCTGRIKATQCGDDIARIDHDIGRVLPGMRIVLVMVLCLTAVLLLDAIAHGDALGCHHNLAAITRGLHHPLHPALKPQTVDHHQFGARHRLDMVGSRLEYMSILIRPYQTHYRNTITADIGDDIAKYAKTGYHRQARLHSRSTGKLTQQDGSSQQEWT